MITPAQLRNTAKFGQPLRKETLLELADFVEHFQSCKHERTHRMKKWENVSRTDTVWQWMRQCCDCDATEFRKTKPMEVG